MSDGATMPRILRRLDGHLRAAGLSFVNLSRVFPRFSVDALVSRETNEIEKDVFLRVQQTANNAAGEFIPDSAVALSDGKVVTEGEGGMDALIDQIAIEPQLSPPAALVRACPTGLAGVLPSVIGPQTIQKCANAGIQTIILDVNSTVVAERDRFEVAMSQSKIEIVSG